jgi:AraC family transcriptional regulator
MPTREDYLRMEFEARINRAVDYAYAHCHRDFELAEMADAACFSRFHFHRMFLALTGETPGEFVRRVRLSRAAGQLRNDPRRSVTDVALDNGFSGSSVFARQFKERFGVSASEYRRAAHSVQRDGNQGQAQGNGGQSQSKDGKAYSSPDLYDEGIQFHKRSERMDTLQYTVEIKELETLTVAYARHIGPYNEIGEAFGRLMRWAGPRGVMNASAKVLGIYHDDPDTTPVEKLRSSACVSVPEGTKADGDIGIMTVPGGTFAVGHFEIAQDEFGAAWNALMGEWLPGSGWQPDERMCYELYLNDQETHPQRKFIIDICEPVKPM